MAAVRPSFIFTERRASIRRLVEEHGMANPRLFGSALHGDDVEGSDLDLLVDPGPETSLFEVARLQLAVESALNMRVDVLTPNALPPKFREVVLSEALAL